MGMASDNGGKAGKLAKLTQLEAEVAKLSEQLKANKKTILLLKKSLAERDLKIQELESKLSYAQQSLLQKATFTINQCRDQIKNGIDGKIINPVFVQIQQQIEVIQGIVHEARDILNKNKMLIHENISATTDMVHQCPDQAIRYFEKWFIEPARLWINNATGMIDSNVKTSQDLITHKVIYQGKMWYDKITMVVWALPTQAKVIFQVWVEEPAKQKIEALPNVGKELGVNASALLKSLIDQLKNKAEQGVETAIEAVKKSQFWDGKHKAEVT
jgi:hypothetical protein